MKLAVFTKNRSNPAYAAARLGADRAAARLGAQTVHYVPEKADDPIEQGSLIEQAIAARPDAMVLVPAHPTAVNAAIRQVNAAGIPLIGCISRASAAQYICFVGSDDYRLALAVAHVLLRKLDAGGDVAIVEGPPDSPTSIPRVRAFRDAVAEYAGVRVVASCNGRYLREPARDAFRALLDSIPRLDAVLAANDSMALGAIDVLRARGRSARVAGVNAIPEAIAAIRSGDMIATADFSAMNIACVAAECAVRHVRGERVPAEIMLPVEVVDSGNYALWDRPYESRDCPGWEAAVGSANAR